MYKYARSQTLALKFHLKSKLYQWLTLYIPPSVHSEYRYNTILSEISEHSAIYIHGSGSLPL